MTALRSSAVQKAEQAFAQGRQSDALQTLETAAGRGDANAGYALAVAQAYGQGGEVDRKSAIQTLETIAPKLVAARRFLRIATASGWRPESGWADAVADLIDGARGGDAADLREVGLLLLMYCENEHALSALLPAAKASDPAAIMALIRMGISSPELSGQARAALAQLSQSRHPLAEELSGVEATIDLDANFRPIDWTFVKDLLAQPEFPAAPASELVSDISARSHRLALHPAVCDYVLTSGLSALRPSTVVDPETGNRNLDPHRRSLSATFAPHMQDMVIHTVERRMASLVDIPWSHAERLVMLFYRPGEEYKPHVDYFSPDEPGGTVELDARGQRIATGLVCLHPATIGGETRFPRFDTNWNGETGDALTFRNVNAAGQPEPLSLHQGMPVSRGWKAISSLWIREREMM